MSEKNLETSNETPNKKCCKNYTGIFWGMFLVTVGLLLLGRMYGLFHFYWFNVFRLWPLVIIWVGIRVLPIQQIWKNVSSIFLLAVAVVLLFVLPAKSCHHDFWCGKFHKEIEKKIDDLESDIEDIDIDDIDDIDINNEKVTVSVDTGVVTINRESTEAGEKKVIIKKIKL